MVYDWFFLIHSCIASTFLFAIYQYCSHWKKPTKFLRVPSLSFGIAWVLAATSLSCSNSALVYFTKVFTMVGVYFGFIALIGLIIVDIPQIQRYWEVQKQKFMELKNKLKKHKQP